MSTKIGRFDVLSELSRSAIGAVYKALDPESGQTIALKTVRPEALGEQYAPLIQGVLEEATASQVLSSHNVTQLFGAQEMAGQFCAAMEYVQGNSIGTMLARKEGFSIWDLQDIARQTCQGLDHAHVRQVAHFSLEPAKIMVSWDGTVKILSFGVSRMSTFNYQAPGKALEVLHYMSPEQVRGEAVDPRSNMFSLGAILYEMVTETKAFPGEDADQVRQLIQEHMPAPPAQVNRKLHPALSEVIMKALAKAPEARYQNGQELVNDLERCKENPAKTAAKKPAASVSAPAKAAPPASTRPAFVPATVAPTAPVSKPQAPPAVAQTPKPAVASAAAKAEAKTEVAAAAKPVSEFAVTASAAPAAEEAAPAPVSTPPSAPAWRAAAAGFGGTDSSSSELSRAPKLDSSEQFISTCIKASVDALTQEEETMSAAAVKPQPAAPKIAVDPMMQEAEKGEGAKGMSFSEITELPPLKEIYTPPPPVESEPAAAPAPVTVFRAVPEKPRVQPQVVAKQAAKKAVSEIKKTPPKLFMYSIAAAVGVILLVVVGIMFHVRSENAEDGAETAATAPATQAPPQPATSQPAAVTPAQPEATTVEVETPVAAPRRAVSVTPKYHKKTKAQAAAPVLVPGQLTVNSTPQGADVSLDDRHDPSWVTPFNMSGLLPGQHLVKVTKAGFAGETRSIEVASGSKSFLVVELAPLTATLTIASTPAGASVLLDGRDTGRVTPTQISIDKAGTHTILVKKAGYLDETTTANFQPGQLLHFSPSLKALGNTDDIKIGGGKLKKIFGGGGESAGMGAVVVHTQPKGAQVAINNRILDKLAPLEFYLNPGTYVVDITMTGYKDVHRVITVEKNGKVSIEETLDRE